MGTVYDGKNEKREALKMQIENSGFVQTATLGKTSCCVCGKEVGLLGRYQMADFNEICKACAKKASAFFVPAESSLPMYNDQMQQIEDGQKLYDAYFAKKSKSMKKFGPALSSEKVLVNEAVGLLCVSSKKHGVRSHLVYRLADLEKYSQFKKKIKWSDGKETTAPYCYLLFHNVPGISEIYVNIGSKYAKLQKYLKKSMGLSGVKGMKNAVNKFKQDMESAKAIGMTAKALFENPGDEQATVSAAMDAFAEADKMFYNGREALLEKANNAMQAVLG